MWGVRSHTGRSVWIWNCFQSWTKRSNYWPIRLPLAWVHKRLWVYQHCIGGECTRPILGWVYQHWGRSYLTAADSLLPHLLIEAEFSSAEITAGRVTPATPPGTYSAHLESRQLPNIIMRMWRRDIVFWLVGWTDCTLHVLCLRRIN